MYNHGDFPIAMLVFGGVIEISPSAITVPSWERSHIPHHFQHFGSSMVFLFPRWDMFVFVGYHSFNWVLRGDG